MLNNKPSATAMLILKSIVFLSLDSQRRYLVPEEVSKIGIQFLGTRAFNQRGFIKILKTKWLCYFIWFVERLLLPGMILHYVLRKRYIEEEALSIINKGEVCQIVILAAGFDSLACRLSKRFPQVNFIEVDHPATQESKKRILEEIGLLMPNVSFLAVDFSSEKLEDKLLAMKQFNPQTNTLFIAEGITMYLDENQINELFSFVLKFASSQNRFIFTFMERREDGKIDFKSTHSMVNFWLNWKKEKFRWGISQREMPNFLRDRKFLLEEIVAHNKLRSKYLSAFSNNEPLAEGECICVAKPIKV